jgi:3-dehydroquinate dehydratase
LAIGGRDMVRQPRSGKAVDNERKYPHIVELAVDDDMLDVELSRRMLDFHRSRKIQARHGRRIISGSQIYYRWCFSDLETARAFMEQFDGEVLQPEG